MRYYRELGDLSYEEQRARISELSESKRIDQEERDYEDACNKRCTRLLPSAEETVVSDLAESVRVL